MTTLLITVHIASCVMLILVVLLQAGRGADMGAAFGGASSPMFGSGSSVNPLTRMTTFTAVAFLSTALFLAVASARRASVFDDTAEPLAVTPQAESAPAAPAGEAAPAAIPEAQPLTIPAASEPAAKAAAPSAAPDAAPAGSAPSGASSDAAPAPSGAAPEAAPAAGAPPVVPAPAAPAPDPAPAAAPPNH